jgi:hypothetical protein
MSKSKILETGQDDFCVVVEDYRIAKLSWQHFKAAYGEFDTSSHPVRDAINDADLGAPFDYLLNGFLFDIILAVARLTDENPKRGQSQRVTLLTLQSHLKAKRGNSSDTAFLAALDSAFSLVKKFRSDDRVQRIRDRRNTHLAHRLRVTLSDLKYGELEVVLSELTKLFEVLAPLFHATKDYPEAAAVASEYEIECFWECLRVGANSRD